MLQYYLFWILSWTFEYMTVLVYYLLSLTYIVLFEYIFLFFTGKKKTQINFCVFVLNCEKYSLFLGRNRVGQTVKKLANRFKREENDVFQNNRNTLIRRVNFFLIEYKLLYIRKFVQTMDTLFFLFAYIYIYITYKGNMKFARLNPDVRTMLQLDQV